MLFLIRAIDLAFQIYTLMLFARILGSWFPEFEQSRIMQFIRYYTDPYLDIFRKIIPPLGMFDLSPIVAFLFLSLIQNLLMSFLIRYFI